jgi:hypothetical protein
MTRLSVSTPTALRPCRKEMAAQVEVVHPATGFFDSAKLAACKYRLRIAIDFYPGDLPRTEEAANPLDLNQVSAREAIAPAATELADELRGLERPVRGPTVDLKTRREKEIPANLGDADERT